MSLRIRPEVVISTAALALSVVAVTSSVYFSRVSVRTTVFPTLVLGYDGDQGWSLRNVGNDPAMNVVDSHQSHEGTEWLEPTRLYPLPDGDEESITSVGHNTDKLSVSYSDAQNREYTSITDEYLTEIFAGRDLPVWKESEIHRVWEH